MDHTLFRDQYNAGEIFVMVNKNKAGDFMMSEFADRKYRPAHLFWTWLGIISIPASVLFWIFYGWIVAIGCFIAGLVVLANARKSAAGFVLKNMVEDNQFFIYVLTHGGAVLVDKSGNKIS